MRTTKQGALFPAPGHANLKAACSACGWEGDLEEGDKVQKLRLVLGEGEVGAYALGCPTAGCGATVYVRPFQRGITAAVQEHGSPKEFCAEAREAVDGGRSWRIEEGK